MVSSSTLVLGASQGGKGQCESGISSVEYALLLSFVAAGIIVAADILSDAVATEMNEAADCIAGDGTSATCSNL